MLDVKVAGTKLKALVNEAMMVLNAVLFQMAIA